MSYFSFAIFSGMAIIVLYLFTAFTKDKPIPVLPEVASIIVDSPGTNAPFYS